MFEELLEITQINGLSKVLEIGTNNSLATLPLVSKGINILTVDLNSEPIKSKITPQIVFKNLAYEDIQLAQNLYDLIYITKSLFILKENYTFANI